MLQAVSSVQVPPAHHSAFFPTPFCICLCTQAGCIGHSKNYPWSYSSYYPLLRPLQLLLLLRCLRLRPPYPLPRKSKHEHWEITHNTIPCLAPFLHMLVHQAGGIEHIPTLGPTRTTTHYSSYSYYCFDSYAYDYDPEAHFHKKLTVKVGR